jgi:hypothetical protein
MYELLLYNSPNILASLSGKHQGANLKRVCNCFLLVFAGPTFFTRKVEAIRQEVKAYTKYSGESPRALVMLELLVVLISRMIKTV